MIRRQECACGLDDLKPMASSSATAKRFGRFCDKLHDNLFHLGLIAALFPCARVIFCERDPRDVCLSNYFQVFTEGNARSCDLIECSHRCRQTCGISR